MWSNFIFQLYILETYKWKIHDKKRENRKRECKLEREREGVAAAELLNPIANVGEQLGEGKREGGGMRRRRWMGAREL